MPAQAIQHEWYASAYSKHARIIQKQQHSHRQRGTQTIFDTMSSYQLFHFNNSRIIDRCAALHVARQCVTCYMCLGSLVWERLRDGLRLTRHHRTIPIRIAVFAFQWHGVVQIRHCVDCAIPLARATN